jgi:caleosin-related protein
MSSPAPLRLVHSALGGRFIVHEGTVYADLDGDGRIAKSDRYTGPAEADLLAAASHFHDYYDVPFPGAKSLDPQITSGGRLNRKEAEAFARDPQGVIARRPDLLGHLDFFDRADGDGMISLRENYASWRALGYRALKALILTLGSAAVFGNPSDGFAIDVERIAEKRPKGSTRIYGPDGNVDQARLAEFVPAFGASGVLTHDQLRAALAERAALGTVPRRQFESFLILTETINGSKTVTRDQFLGLFDNTLFWTAASRPDISGRRKL